MNFYQRLVIRSFFSRLIAVRNSLYFKDNFINVFSSEDKLRVALNMDIFNLASLNFIHILKFKNTSYLLTLSDLYSTSFNTILNFCCLPIIESKIEKSLFIFKPFRDNKDFFFHLKNIYYEHSNYIKSCILNNFVLITSKTTFWLFKHFPLIKKLLFIYLNNMYKDKINFNIYIYLFTGLV